MPLEQHAPDVWSATTTIALPGFTLPLRMSVARLPSGGLWLHSPIPLDDALAASLDALGPVEHIVAPNKLHHLYAGDALARYPQASLWAAPGLPAKRPELAWRGELDASAPPAEWGGVIQQRLVEGAPFLGEVVFFHEPSRTLFVTDLLFNVVHPASRATSFVLWLSGTRGKLGLSREVRFFLIRDRAAAGQSARDIIAWPFERILPGHGDAIEQRAHEPVTQALAWLTAQ